MEKKEVKVGDKNFYVKKPGSKDIQGAKKVYSKEFLNCIQEGIVTKAKLKDLLNENGIWTDQDQKVEEELIKEINDIEMILFKGRPGQKRVSIKEGKDLCFQIKRARGKYSELIAKRQSYEQSTAESIAEDARFDYLMSCCCFNEDGTKVYNSYEDYVSKSSDEGAYDLGIALSSLLFNLDEMNMVEKLPENQFLKMFDLVNEDMRLVNKDGQLIDLDGRLVNESGFYIDEEGNRVDKFGNSLNEDGILGLDVIYLDDDGEEIILDKEELVEIQEKPESE